ncbi:lipid-A-disaccharide synthase [Marinicauda salina]|uniref:Lipid-A-disaccharide synthase n=1 Tax=Marinicauda salina TaxID=2135793 RepID=A0A2U2BTA8_9PROT|nr:lipid-A-disaccharide synthase [Marinicauda salina]PWE17235.1 lipid-A-disaccharide synthase [Marinicauda salina]
MSPGASRPPRVFLVAAEPSGDALGADLIAALREQRPDVEIAGVGGPAMARLGVESPFDISDLSVLGVFDGLTILKLVHQRARETAEAARAFGADAVVLIDSWGFMLRAAWKLRELAPDIPLIKYVGPQVFATRPGRAKTLARTVDHLLAIHPFDPPYYAPHGLPVTFVGNPVLDRDLSGDGPGFRARHGIAPDAPVLLMLFGSRRKELERLFPPFAEAASRLLEANPELRLVAPLAPSIAEPAREMIAGDPRLQGLIAVDADERNDAYAAGDVALACSGTATVELSRVGVPTIAAYRLGWLAWAIARAFLMRAKYISLVNLAADRELIPEFVQMRCTGETLACAVQSFLDDPALRAETADALRAVTRDMLGEERAPSRSAAEAVLRIASGEPQRLDSGT